MASYTTSLRLVQPSAGDTNWGITVNTGLTALVDSSVAGTASITMTAANYTLSNNNGAADESRAMFLVLGGTPGASFNVICPAVSKLYFVTNNTGSAQTVKTASGTGISVPDGARMTLRCDGTDVVVAQNYFGSLTLGSPLVATSGGTGQSSYAVGDLLFASTTTALSKLAGVATGNALISGGVGAAPSYGKIGLTTHVSGTLPVANGGTGITSFGTGVATALGINVGSAGAFVVNGGALGTPASGVATNLTGLPLTTGVTGTLGTANGGTGLTSFTTNQIFYATATNTIGQSANLTFDGTNTTVAGTSTAGKFIPTANTTSGTGMYLPASNTLGFSTGGLERLRIDSAGNVGFGTTPSPWSNTGNIQLRADKDIAGGGGSIRIQTNTYIDSGFKYIGTGAASYYQQFEGEHTWAAAASGTAGNAISWSVPMKLTDSGYLLLGYSSSNGAYRLQVNSQIFATSATIATSDGRYKENVAALDGALKLIKALKPVTFTWKPHQVHNFDTTQIDVGFIAQDVQEAMGDAVFANQVVKSNTCTLKDNSTESFLGIADGKLIPVLVRALQEQQDLIDNLRARVNALEERISK